MDVVSSTAMTQHPDTEDTLEITLEKPKVIINEEEAFVARTT
jgi:hypothetical protein